METPRQILLQGNPKKNQLGTSKLNIEKMSDFEAAEDLKKLMVLQKFCSNCQSKKSFCCCHPDEASIYEKSDFYPVVLNKLFEVDLPQWRNGNPRTANYPLTIPAGTPIYYDESTRNSRPRNIGKKTVIRKFIFAMNIMPVQNSLNDYNSTTIKLTWKNGDHAMSVELDSIDWKEMGLLNAYKEYVKSKQ